jgi:hypothetical protein
MFLATTLTKCTLALLPATHSVDLFRSRCRTENKFARELASFTHASSALNFSNLETYNPDLAAEVVPLRSFPEQQTNNLSDDCHFRTLELLTHLPGKWMRD